MQNLVIVDYQTGNLHSLYKRFSSLGASVCVSSDPQVLQKADKLILPGVGHFARAMQSLHTRGLLEALSEAALLQHKPILGICLGMQLLAKHSAEGDVSGLGWLDAEVVRFEVPDTYQFKVPHTGWNTLKTNKEHPLLQHLEESSEFYFVHTYHMRTHNQAICIANTDYGYEFVSAVAQDNILGVQFHPEKSHAAGMRLLNNFLLV